MRGQRGAGLAACLIALGLVAAACGSDASESDVSGDEGEFPGASQIAFDDLSDPRPADWKSKYPDFGPSEVGDGSLRDAQENGLQVCANAAAPPFVYRDSETNEIVGLEVDTVEWAAEQLGITEVSYVETEWQSLIPALQAKQCQLLITGIMIRTDRAEVVSFTPPYFRLFDQLTVRADSSYEDPEDLTGETIATLAGSGDYFGAKSFVEDLGGGTSLREFNGINECFLAVSNGTVAACFLDNGTSLGALKEFTDLEALGEAFSYEPSGEYADDASENPYVLGTFGFATSKDAGDLNRAFSIAVREMIDSGEQKRIIEKWDLWTDSQEELIRPDA